MRNFRRMVMGSCALTAFAFSSAAAAADGEPAATTNPVATTNAEAAGSEDIVVTARRREELLQDVPLSVTAISGVGLERQNIRSVTELAVPSLAITVQASLRHLVSFAIRGQRSQESQVLTDPPVGTYFAEVVQPRPFGFANALYDIQSVQVLKGVQGTLFGRNMTGGAVLVEPNHPTFDLGGEIRAQYGNYNHRDLLAVLNLPLATGVALRLAGTIRRRDGFSVDVSNGRRYDDQHYESFRASLLLKPSDSAESLFIADWFNSNEHGTAAFMTALSTTNGASLSTQERLRLQGLNPTNLPAQFAAAQALFAAHRYRLDMGAGEPSSGIYDWPGVLPYEKMRNYGVQNKTSVDLGGVTLKNIFGYRKLSRTNVQDYDGIPAVLINPYQFTSLKNVSEELQLQGDGLGSRLKYTTGVYFFEESGSDGARPNTLPELSILGRFGPAGLGKTPGFAAAQETIGFGRSTTYAAYAAGTFKFTDQLSIAGGFRWNHDERSVRLNPFRLIDNICLFDSDNRPTTPAPPISQCIFRAKKSWHAPTWDATVQYEPNPSTTAYISTRRGWRAGGFSLRAQSAAALSPFDPETVQEYEAGLKNQFRLGSGHLTTAAALFYQDYNNVQRQAPTAIDTDGDGANDTVVTIIRNISKVATKGGELEATLDLDNGLKLNAFYSYVDLKVKKGLQPGEHEMRGIPRHQAGANFSFALPVAESTGKIVLSAGVTYQSATELDDYDVQGRERAYALARGRISWDNIGGTGLGGALFVNNAFNKLYRVGVLGLVREIGFMSSVYGEPRMFGAELSYKF